MANYFVIGNTFKPYSFDELIKPYQIYGQAYQAAENQYTNLSEQASAVEKMANEQSDPEAYKRYKSYADDLKAQADALATQGLTPQARTNILGLRSRYQSEITPIEAAYNRRSQLSDEQRKAKLADSSLIFDTDAATMSLDDLIANPTATYNSLSGADVAKRTGEMAAQAAEAMLNDPQYSSVWKGQYVQQMLQQGYTPAQVLAAAQNDPNAPAELKGIKDTIKAEVGFENWDENNQAKIEGYINQGLEKAVGKPKVDIMKDYTVQQQLERAQLQLQRDKLNFEIEKEKGILQPDGSRIKPLGGGKVMHIGADGTILPDSILPETPEEKQAREDATKLTVSLSKVSNIKGMADLGYEPIGAVIQHLGEWQGGRQGEDIQNTYRASTRSNLTTEGLFIWNSGNYTYTPRNNAEIHVVTDLPSIPGFTEFIEAAQSGASLDEEQMSKTAFGQILQQAARSGIDPVTFLSSDDYQIVKVKAGRSRATSDTPWDYIIYKRS